MTYRFVILRHAQRDVKLIVRWLAKRTTAGVLAWRCAFDDALRDVVADPFRWNKVAESGQLPAGLHQYLFRTRHGNTYRIVYLVEQDEVRVLRVRSPGQRPLRATDIRGGS